MKTILKVIAWAIVAAAAVALWLAGLFYVPLIEPFGFPLGIVYSIAIFSLIEAADKLRRKSKGGTRR